MYFIDKTECTGCMACVAVCPQKCIQSVEDKEGFLYPSVNEKMCVSCGKCRKICPVVNKVHSLDDMKVQAYVVCHKENDIRLDSASGGAFTMFAQYILQLGGAVYGAGYDDKRNVVHKMCNKFEDLEDLRGSKYVQSGIENIYEEIKSNLENEKYVLFTGTPCQNEGLLNYLDKTYERLITVDIACHGVASPLLWEQYLKDEERRLNKHVIYKKCRDKSRGWRQWGMVTEYSDGTKLDKVYYEDLYMKIYLSHNAMRYSCYQCKFRNIFNKKCDATMADCWGIEYFAPKLDDGLGASIVFLHSDKIRRLWDQISSFATVKKVNSYRALQGNIGAWGKNMSVPKARKMIYRDILSSDSFEEVADMYCHIPGRKEKIINKYPNLHRRYAWIKSVIAPLRLKLVYRKMMQNE